MRLNGIRFFFFFLQQLRIFTYFGSTGLWPEISTLQHLAWFKMEYYRSSAKWLLRNFRKLKIGLSWIAFNLFRYTLDGVPSVSSANVGIVIGRYASAYINTHAHTDTPIWFESVRSICLYFPRHLKSLQSDLNALQSLLIAVTHSVNSGKLCQQTLSGSVSVLGPGTINYVQKRI